MVGSNQENVRNALQHATEVRVQHVKQRLVVGPDLQLMGNVQMVNSKRYSKTLRSYVVNGRVLMDQLRHLTMPLTKVSPHASRHI